MIFGTRMSWRLWSPLIALVWAAVAIAFAGTAQADPGAGGHAAPPGSAPATSGLPQQASDTAAVHAGKSSPGGKAGTSGDITQPQPISHADANSGGANGQCPDGPYCSTRDGSASGNGSGRGLATGKPCAGCVGKADNKNPAGQKPNATDRNAGYECDTNHGIARSNPAHTACAAPQQDCVPTESVPCVPQQNCVPTESVPCVPQQNCVPTESVPCVPPCVATESVPCVPPCVATESVPCAPSAPECVPTASVPCTPGSTVVESPALGAAVPPAAVSSPARVLPNTGSPADLPWLTAAALGTILTGIALVARRRRPAGR